MNPEPASPGQRAALEELSTVARINDGRIRIVGELGPDEPGDLLAVDLEIDCRGEPEIEGGFRFQDWEPVTVLIPAQYPYVHPEVFVEHRRFAHLPHVLWAEGICLYLAANDWDPTRGMRGFIGQLLTWFASVADGTIAGVEIPWHAPLTQLRTGDHLVVRPEIPAFFEGQDGMWVALAVLTATSGQVYEVRSWMRVEDLKPLPPPLFVAPVIALPDPIGFTYPRRVGELIVALHGRGLPILEFDDLHREIRKLSTLRWESTGVRPPDFLILGSPAPSRYAIPSRIGHIAAWELGTDSVLPSLADAVERVGWVTVHDQRPSISTRRDTKRPARWLTGKRVLVLGCGGLGAPAAEFCVRAGAAAVAVVDDGTVHPGILVRQPYAHGDIGRNKAEALAGRLAEIAPACDVTARPEDALAMFLDGAPVPDADLVIDATANRSVAAVLERTRWTSAEPPPPLLSMMVGHDCERGVATLALRGAGGAGVDILRRLAITASTDEELSDVLDDFFPAHPRTALFQPEPGCSDPTYAGSAADLATFAGQLLNDGLSVLGSADGAEGVRLPRRWASVVRTTSVASDRTRPRVRQWADDSVFPDRRPGPSPDLPLQVRVEAGAWAAMRREVARMAGRRGPHVETGGLLLGQIDRASQVVWVTEADGLPPGSTAYVEGLELDPTRARELAARRRHATRGMVAYIGTWHTHPDHLANPSEKDVAAMREIAGEGVPVLLMILGGGTGRLARWIDDGSRRPEMSLEIYFPE